MSLIVYAIPVFFLLIGIEVLVDKLKRTNYYRFNDAITNLSCGIGSQLAGKVLLGTATVLLYKYILAQGWTLFDLPSEKSGSPVWLLAVTWVALFLGVDLCYYWFHRLAHEISVLWGSHIVHHQSEEYNLTVALRQAWFQGAFSWFFYIPLALLGFSFNMFALLASVNTLYQFWIHTKHINKLPKPIEYIFNTPSHHRVHHGVNPKYIDRNHAGSLIIWDRLFGTFQAEEEEVVYGITTQTNSWNPLWVNFDYWLDLFAHVGKAKGFKNKLKMLFLKPGWRPEELGGIIIPKEVSAASFHKYDIQVPSGLNTYIFTQYVLLLLGTTAFLVLSKDWAYWLQLSITALIVVAIVSLGGLLERKKWAIPLEVLRNVLLVIALSVLFYSNGLFMIIVAITSVVAIVSAVWVLRFRNDFAEEQSLSVSHSG
jgi:sterol desaturase/sphingolipid hydroxylase (fatty acid hydroxylase superfamily)